MAVASRADIKQRRGRSPALVALVLFVVVVSLFAASKFSHRGAQRPRYLMPLYTSVAVAFGWGIASLGRRSRVAAARPRRRPSWARTSWGSCPGCRAAARPKPRDRALLAELDRLQVRTGYAGFWVAPKYTFLSEGRVVLSGELGPIVSWVHPGHAARVREDGPDAYLVGTGQLATAFEARLRRTCVPLPAERRLGGVAIFHDLCRRVSLEEVAGYDLPAGPSEPPEPLEDDP